MLLKDVSEKSYHKHCFSSEKKCLNKNFLRFLILDGRVSAAIKW